MSPRHAWRTIPPYSNHHAARWSYKDAGAISVRPRMTPRTTTTPGAIPCIILSTVLDHCTPTIRGEDDDFRDLLCMYTAPPCVYKRGRWALSYPSGQNITLSTTHRAHTLLSPDIDTRLNHLAETWEFPSLSRLACTPYYKHLGVR